MTRFLLAFIFVLGSIAILSGCNEEETHDSMDEVVQDAEGKESVTNPGEAPGGTFDR